MDVLRQALDSACRNEKSKPILRQDLFPMAGSEHCGLDQRRIFKSLPYLPINRDRSGQELVRTRYLTGRPYYVGQLDSPWSFH